MNFVFIALLVKTYAHKLFIITGVYESSVPHFKKAYTCKKIKAIDRKVITEKLFFCSTHKIYQRYCARVSCHKDGETETKEDV
jgi:hypothetical protein